MLGRFTRACAALGVLVLFGCAAITVVDIIGRRTVGLSLPGLIDLSQLLVMIAMFLCIPYAFERRANIDVDLIHKQLARPLRRALDVLWSLLSMAFLVAVVWHAGKAALQVYGYDETSPTLAMPMVLYWLPVLFGCGLSAIICLRQAFSPPDGDPAPGSSPPVD